MESRQYKPNPTSSCAADDAAAFFASGLASHGAGRLDEAFAEYEAALQRDSRHPGALHHLGILGYQIGNHELALEFLGAALNADPGNPSLYADLGKVFDALGEHGPALESYEQALAIDPLDAAAWQHHAAALQKIGRLDEALESCKKAHTLDPEQPDTLAIQGAILGALGRYREAQASCDEALRLDPQHAEALLGQARSRQQLGCLEDALAAYDRLLGLAPALAGAHHGRGKILVQLRRTAEAVDPYQQAAILEPDNAAFRLDLGDALRELGCPNGALQCFDAALRLSPGNPEIHHSRGLALQVLKRFDEALASFDTVLAALPDHVEAMLNRGNALQDMGRIDDALHCYDTVIARHGDAAPICNNRGNALKAVRRYDEALACYSRAIALKPDYAVAHWNRALLDLQYGRFAQGWRGYEWRWKNEHLTVYRQKRDFAQPLWCGDDGLQGKTILLFAEQGLGDTLQFCRYVPLVAARGARVILEVQAPLVGLMRTLEGAFQVIARGDPLPPFDVQCPLMTLPLAFGTGLDSIPAITPSVAPDASLLPAWQALLGPRVRPRIGLVWSGNPTHANDHNRSMPFAQLATLFALDCQFVSLQKEHREDEQAALDASGVLRTDVYLNDFSDTAALCEQMDLVISVDTSVAHLAGALGRPLWVLLPHVADWRWLTERSDSPWYPGARLFRQSKAGGWDSVIAEVQAALQALPRS